MEAQAYALLRVPCAEVQRRNKKGTNGFLYREQSVVHTLYRAIKGGVKRLVQRTKRLVQRTGKRQKMSTTKGEGEARLAE